MNSVQLNAWAGSKHSGVNKSPLIRQLQTGTMPAGQGSSIAPVNMAPVDAYLTNAVPFVDYPQHVAPVGTPGRQNQRNLPTAQTPPWISVPLCAQGNMGRGLKRPTPLGILGGGAGNSLNLPSKNKPIYFTVAAAE
jgi:hypothetical protein